MTALLISDPDLIARLKAERQAHGLDRRDEVWDGVYVMSPSANNQHQRIVSKLLVAFHSVIDLGRLGESFASINVSDRAEGWTENYRVPDLSVYLTGNPAIDQGTHWEGGGDFVVEILSPGDPARRKRDFYASVGVREWLIIDRDPWSLELYRAMDGQLALAGSATVKGAEVLVSEVLPLNLSLVDTDCPRILVTHRENGDSWLI